MDCNSAKLQFDTNLVIINNLTIFRQGVTSEHLIENFGGLEREITENPAFS